MRKKWLSLLLALLILMTLVPCSSAANAEIYFVAVDDSIPLTLPNSTSPYYSGGVLYVPYTVFDAEPGGVIPSYNVSEQTLVLFRRGARLIFDLSNGTVTDEDKNTYNHATVSRNGLLYVPIEFCAAHFGLSYITLSSLSGYPIFRFTTGNEVYDHTMFVEKAENLIVYLAEQYQSGVSTPSSAPNGGNQTPEAEEPHVSGAFSLAIVDAAFMSDAAKALAQSEQRAAFFLTVEEIDAAPELVRSLYAAGHVLGITCTPDAEDAAIALRDANEALYRVLHRKTTMVLLTAAQSEFCPGYCIFVRPDTDLSLDALLAQSDEEQLHLLVCGEDAVQTLDTLESAGASLRLLRETSPLALLLNPPTEEDVPAV